MSAHTVSRKVCLTPEHDREIQRLAAEEGSSLSTIIRRLVARGVAQERQLWRAAESPASEGQPELVGAER